MISRKNLYINNINHEIIVFDEPIPEYYELMLLAASGKDKLAKNYRKPIHRDKEFVTILKINNTLALMFATEKDLELPSNVARGFVRTFVNPRFRLEYTQHSGYHNEYLRFYSNWPEYYTDRGISTIFTTRNFISSKRSEKALEIKLNAYGWVKHPIPLIYNHTPQWFFIYGDSTFLKSLPEYSESSV